MSFPCKVYFAAVAGAFLATLVSLPLWRRWCLRSGLIDEPGRRKIHDAPVPLAGGLAVLTGLLLPLAFGAAAIKLGLVGGHTGDLLGYGLNRRVLELGAILLGALGMTALGVWDDKYELRPLPKFAGQCLIALLVAAAGARVTLFVDNLVFSYAVTVLWILTVTNAFNFMDNMNGLCAGLGAIGASCFGIIAATADPAQYLVALIALTGAGALLGFLPYNFPKARSFLGDAGSHLVGYLLAVLAILPHFYSRRNPHPWAVLKPLLVLAIPLLDLAMVVILRWRTGQPFYVGDTNHLSHQLVRHGLTPTTAVLMIWLAAAALGAIALF
jgi:UDP-GlcNAc:undecaprenyl-phosphate/decaprenyl-phosphate GlcNAc-1-phosphate transferase